MYRRHRLAALLVLSLILWVIPAQAVDTETAIVDLVRATYQLEETEYELELRANQITTRMVDPADLTIRALSQKEPLGLFTMIVEIHRDGVRIDRGQVRVYIRKFAEVLVASGKVSRHQELSEDLFELLRTDVTNLREQAVTTFDQITGQRSTRTIRHGRILTTAALELLPDIENGGEVMIAFSEEWGTITAPGRALQDGWVGKQLRVKNLATGKVIRGKVMSQKSVEVNP